MTILLNRELYSEASQRGMTVSHLLELKDPSPEGAKLDAFERQLQKAGILVKTNNEAGTYASTIEEAFYRTSENEFIFPELVSRTVREATSKKDVMLANLIGRYDWIEGSSHKAPYIDQDLSLAARRVAEGTDIPCVEVKLREQSNELRKVGSGVIFTYEALRRMRIDMLRLTIQQVARADALKDVKWVLDVIKNGDNPKNKNAAPVLEQKAGGLDASATAGKLTIEGFLAFLMQFKEFPCDTIIASEKLFKQLMTHDTSLFSVTDVMSMVSGGKTANIKVTAPQLPKETMQVFYHDDIPENQLYGINKAYAIEQVNEAGSDIQEDTAFIRNQTKLITTTINRTYGKMFVEATKILDVSK